MYRDFVMGEVRRLHVYLSIYLLPLLMYLNFGGSIARFRALVGADAVIIWTAVMLLILLVSIAVRIAAFRKDLSRLTAPEKEELAAAIRDKRGFKLFDGRLIVTSACICHTGGVIVPLEEIRSVVIECSETGYLPVYHMYIYTFGNSRRLIRIGMKTITTEFEKALPDTIEVTRQQRPLFGRGSVIGGVKKD